MGGKHKFAKAHGARAVKQVKTVRGQPFPESEPLARRQKVIRPATTIDQFIADDLRTERRKRKREDHLSGMITLGDIVHPGVVPHLLGPVLKRRFMGSNL